MSTNVVFVALALVMPTMSPRVPCDDKPMQPFSTVKGRSACYLCSVSHPVFSIVYLIRPVHIFFSTYNFTPAGLSCWHATKDTQYKP